MATFINTSCYKFVPLHDLKFLREKLRKKCRSWGLKGTILLSTEGINFFTSGPERETHLLLEELRSIDGLGDLTPKLSESDHQPFNRMLVRIKKEIIAFGVEGINPAKKASPKMPAQELKRWIDEGRDFTLLDTRNDYEIKLGTFKKALPIGVECFRNFPNAARKLPPQVKQKPVVMFCTGGIRCEKAGPFMEQLGFQVHQLEGGILKYFEEVGNEHYEGECFVFDHRVSIDPTLKETEKRLCFACQTPLTEEEQKDFRYIVGKSCPYCYISSKEQIKLNVRRREKLLREISSPLPGSMPYKNLRPIKVPARYDGHSFIDFVSNILSHISKETWLTKCEQGLLLDGQKRKVSSFEKVKAGERYFHVQPEQPEPDVNLKIRFLYEDEALIVISKPAPLPVHPGGRFNRNTLQYVCDRLYAPQKVRPAHRLDANTTGLLVLARTKHFAGLLQPQFSEGRVSKKYLARTQGHPADDQFDCKLSISETAGKTGSRTIDENGVPSHTQFRVIERSHDGTTLLEVTPLTGRTNQIRIHLWALGWPVCNDPIYLPDRKIGETQTLSLKDSPLLLHAHQISFIHPLTRKQLRFTDPNVPNWVC